MKAYILSIGLLLSFGAAAKADSLFIRVGDVDGFGYGNGGSLLAANHGTVNPNGDAVLGTGDFLPDLNQNGTVAYGSGDDFDHRSDAEIAGTAASTNGFVNTGSTGSQWTDLSLSTTYKNTFPNGNFPDPNGDDTPNDAQFVFNFTATQAQVNSANPVYFNTVFGDYDVSPAQIDVTFGNGHAEQVLNLTLQPGNQDGLIQASFAALNFNDVFTLGQDGLYHGQVTVTFNAPNEPYTAFDYAELSTDPISIVPVPEPASLSLLALGGVAAAMRRKRRA